MKLRRFFLFATLSALALSARVFGQGAAGSAPATAENLIENGGFEQSYATDNLLDGVDNEGFLAGGRRSVPAVREGGGIGDLPLPISVSFTDINGDGLPDLVTVDPNGVFRVYFNSGTKTEPKFTNCEIIPLFLSRAHQPGFKDDRFGNGRRGLKLALFDWGGRGVSDLVVGDYAGEIFFIPNTGSRSVPEWRQPRAVEDAILKTTRSGELWGNLFAPCVADWRHNGKPDLIVGEGSYSANAVHILLNKSNTARPEFSEDARYYLAYGDGREQLVPTVADFNGDGQPDLVVGDRRGQLALYLNPGGWQPGVELPLASLLPMGKIPNLGGCVAPCAGDWNGDGLMDLIIGKANGRIAVAINSGTKEQPKFEAPFEVKGVDLWRHGSIRTANAWSFDSGADRGNLYGFFSVVDATMDRDAAPPEGTHCLKAGYFDSPNRIFKRPAFDFPAISSEREFFHLTPAGKWEVRDAAAGAEQASSTTFVARTTLRSGLRPGATYVLSFKIKGRNVRNGTWTLAYLGSKENAPAKTEHGERGSAKVTRDAASEIENETGAFGPGAQWTTVTKIFQCNFKNPALKALNATSGAIFELRFAIPPFDGVLYVDDVQVVEKKG